MAENQQERTEQPTPKRLEEARRQGQVPRSSELSAAAVLLIAGGGLNFLGGYIGGQLHGLMSASLALPREQAVDETLMVATLSSEFLREGSVTTNKLVARRFDAWRARVGPSIEARWLE